MQEKLSMFLWTWDLHVDIEHPFDDWEDEGLNPSQDAWFAGWPNVNLTWLRIMSTHVNLVNSMRTMKQTMDVSICWIKSSNSTHKTPFMIIKAIQWQTIHRIFLNFYSIHQVTPNSKFFKLFFFHISWRVKVTGSATLPYPYRVHRRCRKTPSEKTGNR